MLSFQRVCFFAGIFSSSLLAEAFRHAAPSAAPSVSNAPSLSMQPSLEPSLSTMPSVSPSTQPSLSPSLSAIPSVAPSAQPSLAPSLSAMPSVMPSAAPQPSLEPSLSTMPSVSPSTQPSLSPSLSVIPSVAPSAQPSLAPSLSAMPSVMPSAAPSVTPSSAPSAFPSTSPSILPSTTPSAQPTHVSVSISVSSDEAIVEGRRNTNPLRYHFSNGRTYEPTYFPTTEPTKLDSPFRNFHSNLSSASVKTTSTRTGDASIPVTYIHNDTPSPRPVSADQLYPPTRSPIDTVSLHVNYRATVAVSLYNIPKSLEANNELAVETTLVDFLTKTVTKVQDVSVFFLRADVERKQPHPNNKMISLFQVKITALAVGGAFDEIVFQKAVSGVLEDNHKEVTKQIREAIEANILAQSSSKTTELLLEDFVGRSLGNKSYDTVIIVAALASIAMFAVFATLALTAFLRHQKQLRDSLVMPVVTDLKQRPSLDSTVCDGNNGRGDDDVGRSTDLKQWPTLDSTVCEGSIGRGDDDMQERTYSENGDDDLESPESKLSLPYDESNYANTFANNTSTTRRRSPRSNVLVV